MQKNGCEIKIKSQYKWGDLIPFKIKLKNMRWNTSVVLTTDIPGENGFSEFDS